MPSLVTDGLLLSYEQGGAGPDLVILHGWGRSGAEWRDVAARYASTHRVTVLDLPGFGGSEISYEAYDIYSYAEVVGHALGKLGVSQCTMLGHSLGGRIATILASRYPDFVTDLILVDSAGVERKPLSVRIKRVFVTIGKMLGLHFILPKKLRESLASADYRNASPTMKKTFANIIDADLTHLFPTIKSPTLIIWGNKDKVLPVRYTKIYRKLIPDCTVRIVYDVGHSPHLEDFAQFTGIVDDYLLIKN